MSEGVYIQIPLVILPLDAFTGKIILDKNFMVSVDGAAAPVIKPDGYRVFMGIISRHITVHLWGGFYQKMQINMDIATLKGKHPVQKVYMLPDWTYPFPKGTSFLAGKIRGGVLLAAALSVTCSQRLCADCNAGDQSLVVFQEKKADFEGSVYLMTDKKRDKYDWTEFLEMTENGYYCLKSPIHNPYTRAEAVLYPAVRYVAEYSGENYFLAFQAVEEEFLVCCCLDNRQNLEFVLHAGDTRYQDF